MEIIPTSIHPNLPKNGNAQCRPLCIKSVTSNSNIYESKSRSTVPSSGCISTELEAILPICIPPFLPNFQSSQASIETVSRKNDNHYPSLASSALVSSSSVYVYPTANSAAKQSTFINEPTGTDTSTNSNIIVGSSGLVGLRKTLFEEGISG